MRPVAIVILRKFNDRVGLDDHNAVEIPQLILKNSTEVRVVKYVFGDPGEIVLEHVAPLQMARKLRRRTELLSFRIVFNHAVNDQGISNEREKFRGNVSVNAEPLVAAGGKKLP